MTLNELSAQYRQSGEACRIRMRELETKLETEPMGETERLRLRRRIYIVGTMAQDAIATSRYLECYYGDDKNGKRNKNEYVC